MLTFLFPRRQARPTSFRPCLEVLEGRDVPSTLTVTSTLDSGKGSLRYEISHAHKNDTVVFAPSLNGQTIHLTSGELLIQQNLTINGPGASQLTIDANYSSRVFEVAAKAQVALYGLSITNGRPAFGQNGGGIDNHGTLSVEDCIFSGDSVGTSGNGGGIYNAKGATLTVTGCAFDDSIVPGGNFAFNGGAIYNAGKATINSTTLSNNSASGGDFFEGDGGGIYNVGTMTITSCTLSDNRAGENGGAIYNALGGTLTVQNCTLSSNNAAYEGNGIYNAGSLAVANTAFLGNDDIFGPYVDEGGNTFG